MKRKDFKHMPGYLCACAVLLFVLTGCGRADAGTKQDGQMTAQDISDADAGKNEDAVQNDVAGERGEAGVSFEGQDIEGNTVSSSIFSESKLTMVNVWATYCNPCLREMPELGELAKEYEPADFQLIGIISDVQEGAEENALEYASGLIEQTGADYPHLLLNESIYRGLLTEVSAVPTTFFFNENGEVLDVVVGAMQKSAWEEKINSLLEK